MPLATLALLLQCQYHVAHRYVYGCRLLGGVLLTSLGGTAINMVALAGVSMAVAGIAAFLVIKE